MFSASNSPVQSLSALVKGGVRSVSAIFMAQGETTRAQRDAVVAFAVRVASAAILYLSQIVLARWMGASDYGVYVLVWTWVLILGSLSGLGMSTLVIRLVPELRAEGRLVELAGLLRSSRRLALVSGTVVALLAGTALWVLGDHVASPYVWPAFLALFCIPMFALAEIQDGVGRGSAMLVAGLLPPYVLRPLLVLAVMALARLADFPMAAETAVASAIVATWGSSMFQLLLLRRYFATTTATAEGEHRIGRWLALSLPMLVVMLAEIALQNIDLMVVSAHLSAADVGIYYAASKTMSLIMFVHYAVGSAVANRFASLNAVGDRDRLVDFVHRAIGWTFWPSLLAASVLLTLGRPLLSLFGAQFVDGHIVMAILAIGFLAKASVGPADYLLNMLGQQRLCAAAIGGAAVLDLMLSLWLVPRYGMIGAATATSIALVASACAMNVVVRRKLALDVSIWRIVAVAIMSRSAGPDGAAPAPSAASKMP